MKNESWYGIKGIRFIWNGEWADPQIEYKGRRCSAYVVEDTMWERWIYPDDKALSEERENDTDGFCRLCDLALFPEQYN